MKHAVFPPTKKILKNKLVRVHGIANKTSIRANSQFQLAINYAVMTTISRNRLKTAITIKRNI